MTKIIWMNLNKQFDNNNQDNNLDNLHNSE